MMDAFRDIDIAIAGGGLAGSLIAWALHQHRPDLHVVIVEQGESLGANHTWSFHHPDLPPSILAWLDPLISHRWSGQQVIFPTHERRLTTPYYAITSDRLAAIIGADLEGKVLYGTSIAQLSPDAIDLADGRTLSTKAVIDCRGAAKTPHLDLGFQKFVGQEIRFTQPHGLRDPVIMDASVAQLDGYRFVYILPFDEHTALVEDTRYADGDGLEIADVRRDIADYVAHRGWTIEAIVREETGVLPIALGGDMESFWPPGERTASGALTGVARAGMAAALFHPLTGYSLPYAAILAQKIATDDDPSAARLFTLTRDYAMAQWQAGGFYRLLCRMLFRAAEPDQRYKVLQRHYKLPQPLIERFYAGHTSLKDRVRILAGKPPVPIGKALQVLRDTHISHQTTLESVG